MIDGLDRHVDIEIGPIQMVRMRQLDVAELADRNLSEPGEVLEGQEALLLPEQEPEPVLRNVGDLNGRSGLSTRCGFHPHGEQVTPAAPSPPADAGTLVRIRRLRRVASSSGRQSDRGITTLSSKLSGIHSRPRSTRSPDSRRRRPRAEHGAAHLSSSIAVTGPLSYRFHLREISEAGRLRDLCALHAPESHFNPVPVATVQSEANATADGGQPPSVPADAALSHPDSAFQPEAAPYL